MTDTPREIDDSTPRRPRARSRPPLGSLALLGLAVAQPAAAQQGPPARIGNVWGGARHEPTPGSVVPRESAAGVRPGQPQVTRENDDVERLYHQLEGGKGQGAPAARSRSPAAGR